MSSEKFSTPDLTQEERGTTKPVASTAAIKPRITRHNDDTDISMDAKEKKWLEKTYKHNDDDDQPPPYDTVIKTEKRGRWRKLKDAITKKQEAFGIKKDDILFHFITLCFALGTVLVVEYNLSDWTVSAGIGLISFAFLEAIGFYFDFVTKVRNVVRAILQFTLRWAEKFPLALKNR